MPFRAWAGPRAPISGIAAVVVLLLLLVLPSVVLGADWSPTSRVSSSRGTRLDSLHQLAASQGRYHLVHPRIGPRKADDRVIYQRASSVGPRWPERALFAATKAHRHVVPNLAIDARGAVVAVAWRVRGPMGTTLFLRVSRDGGASFGARKAVDSSRHRDGIGVPAVTVGNDVTAVAWTDRADGKVKVRTSRNGGRSWRSARTVGRTKLSIDCRRRVRDGLVGLAAADRRIHVAWSQASGQRCLASRILVRSSTDRGASWGRQRTITKRSSFGWPELDARGRTVVATVQASGGHLIVARSGRNGRAWSDRLIKAPKGLRLSAGDVLLLPRGRAVISYVEERVRDSKLRATRVISRRSKNDGRSFRSRKTIAAMKPRLRMAPNLAAGDDIIVVYQSGALDGSPRDLFVSRQR